MRRIFVLSLCWVVLALLSYNQTLAAAFSSSGYMSAELSGSQPEDSLSQSTMNAIDSLLNAHVMLDHFGGAVVQIAENGSVIYKKTYGFGEKFELLNGCMVRLNKPDSMVTDELFDLASLTKVFATTLGIMILVDRGKVHLDDPVREYLKEFTGSGKSEITIRELLNHSSGLDEWQPLYYHAKNGTETYRYICQLPLKYKVGEARHYSDLGFMLLGYLIEKVSGEPLDAFMSKELYEPLGLKKTVFNPLKNGSSGSNIAATSHGNPFEYRMVADTNFGYKTNEDVKTFTGWRRYTLRGEVNDGNAYYANAGIAGHAGLFSTVSDLQVLIDLMLNEGSYNGKTFFSPTVVKEFTTMDKCQNGLGWDMDSRVIQAHGVPDGTYGHTGFTGTSVVIIPKLRLSVLLLTNRQNTGVDKAGYYYDLSPVRQKLVDLVLSSMRIESK